MSFSDPTWLLALFLVPAALAAYVAARRRARRYAVRFTAVATLREAAAVTPAWRRHLPAALLLATIATLAVALARPHVTRRVAVGQASVVLITDHSGSMAADDVAPTRLDAAQNAANSFISKVPSSVRVGAVGFSTTPDAAQAPAPDKSAARALIDQLAPGGATATGDAIELALQLLRAGDPKHPPSAIVLLSDGAANAGVDAVTAARQSQKDRIPIYTVALGTPNGVLNGPDPFSPPLAVPPDPQLMAAIARVSGGQTFNAKSAGELSSIYKRLGNQLGSVARKHEVTAEFAIAGLVLLLLAAATSTRITARLP